SHTSLFQESCVNMDYGIMWRRRCSLLTSRIAALPIALLVATLLGTSLLHAQSTGDFTIVVLPDTQNYSQFYPLIFDSQTQWVANNAVGQNITLVIGVGDVVNIGNDATQISNANHSISI